MNFEPEANAELDERNLSQRRFRGLLIVGASMVLVNIVFFWPVYGGGEALFYRDILTNYVPYRMLLSDRILSGQAPLWTDQILGGLPVWADPVNSILYPGQMPFYVLFKYLNPFHAYGFLVGLHFLLAQIGFYRLFRTLNISKSLALFGSAAIAYGTPAICLQCTLQFLYSFAIAGFALESLVILRRAPDRLNVIRLAIWTAVIVTTGDLQQAYLLGLLAIVSCAAGKPLPARRVGAAAAAMAIAGLLSAAIIIPGFEYSRNSARSDENRDADVTLAWSWNPVRVVEWFAPGLFNPPAESAISLRPLEASPADGAELYYSRLSPLLLGLALLPWIFVASRRDTRIRWLLGLCGASVLLATGRYTGVFHLAGYILPGWSQFRFPERMMLPFMIGWAIAAVLTLQLFFRNEDGFAGSVRSKVWLAAAGLVILAGAISEELVRWLFESLRLEPTRGTIPHAVGSFQMALLPYAFAAVPLAWNIAARYRKALFGASIALDLLIGSLPVVHTVPMMAVSGKPLVLRLLGREFPPDLVHHPKISVEMPWFEINGVYDRVTVSYSYWNLMHGNTVMTHPFDTLSGINSSWLADFELADRIMLPGKRHLVEGLDAVIVPENAGVTGEPDERWKCGTPDQFLHARVCHLLNVLPAVRAPHAWETVMAPDVIRARLADPAWNPAEVEFLGRLSRPMAAVPPVPAGSSPDATARLIRWEPELKAAEVERDSPGPVVIRQNYYPGWKVYVNGEKQEPLVANGFQLAGWTPAGKSRIEFRFEPLSVRIGIWISVLTLSGVLLFWLSARRGRAQAA